MLAGPGSTESPIRFVFVGGVPRSGTTLLQRILTRHSRIVGGEEFQASRKFIDFHRAMAARLQLRRSEFYTREELDVRFRTFFNSFFEELRSRRPDAVWVSEKTPANVTVAKELLELFPDARFVHILRDGRDVLASSLAVRQRAVSGSHSHEPVAKVVADRVSARELLRAYRSAVAVDRDLRAHPRFHSLRYESLVSSPESTMRAVFDFLEVPFERSALRVDDGGTTAIFIDEIHHTANDLRRPIDRHAVGRYQRLPLTQRAIAELVLGEDLEALGYPTSLATRTTGALRRALRPVARSLKSALKR
ncbi:MAG: sulfotransferase [Deltaproteobacteria bacterium]|nr:sulfotransferase [Deltaproteobacteria bacterium]